MRQTSRLALLLASVSCIGHLSAQQPTIENLDLRGTIGSYPIGANMHIQNSQKFLAGYYFYASHLTNIALRLTVPASAELTLTGADGSTFHLHFTGNGSEHSAPLNFSNSVGLDGTWTLGAKTLPVHLGLSASTPLGRPRYADVTADSDQAFEARVQQFVHAVLSDDRNQAALLVSYPFRINGKPTRMIRSPRQLKANWVTIFTPSVVARLKEAIPHDMIVRNGEAMLGNGVIWFSNKGADSLNP